MTDTDFERQSIAHPQQPKKMKFQEDQDVFIIHQKNILKAMIIWGNQISGIYTINRIETFPFTELMRGSEAIFETREQAQQHLESIKI